MTKINWLQEVELRKDDLIEHTKQLLKINSVLNERASSATAPLGKGVKEALTFMLQLGDENGFETKNVDNLAGHIQLGEGEELVGILCHVDVVPAGDGWTTDPFEPSIRNNKLYARGAIDDKGPTMAAFYAMKIVKDLNLSLSKRVRMIIGTDEESDWRCVDHYFNKEEMPTYGFAPDADFPIINAEKGIADFEIVTTYAKESENNASKHIVVQSFSSGERKNMVPDLAECSLNISKNHTEIVQQFRTFVKRYKLECNYYVDRGDLILQIIGKSAHAMEPKNGLNAGLYLAQFLTTLTIDERSRQFLNFLTTYFQGDSRGRNLNLNYKDEMSGELTINVGQINYNCDGQGRLGISMRYPVTTKIDETLRSLAQFLNNKNMDLVNLSNSSPHYVPETSKLIKTLQKVYEEQTGQEASLLAIGGGTYARSLKEGVAFGPLFPGRADIAHQKDEYIHIDDLIKATAIYAQAIYELAK